MISRQHAPCRICDGVRLVPICKSHDRASQQLGFAFRPAATLAGVVLAPARAIDAGLTLERLGLVALYVALPARLLARMAGA